MTDSPLPNTAPADRMAIEKAIDRYRLAVHRGSNASLANLEARRRIEADAKQALVDLYSAAGSEPKLESRVDLHLTETQQKKEGLAATVPPTDAVTGADAATTEAINRGAGAE